MTDEAPVERPDDDDYDLLTYGEAGARLAEEIARGKQALRDLEAADAGADQLAATRARIADLEAAVTRQKAAALDTKDFQRFFGYDPKAAR
jgi:hypothetical protein